MEQVPLVQTKEKPTEKNWQEFDDMVFDVSSGNMSLSEFLDKFRVHLPGLCDRLSLRKDNIVDMYDQVFRQKLVLYSKFTKLPSGEPISKHIFEADIKLWQDFSVQVIEPILRRDLHSSINQNLEALYKVTTKVDDQHSLSQYSSLVTAGDTGEYLRRAILTIMKAMNSIYMIEVYTVEHCKAPRESSLSKWIRKTATKPASNQDVLDCEQIVGQFLTAVIEKYFENYWADYFVKEGLKSLVPKNWTEWDPASTLIMYAINQVIHEVIFAQIGGNWFRFANKALINAANFPQFATVLAATNSDYDNRIPEILRKVSEGMRKVLNHFPNTIQPQLNICSESLLSLVELIQNGHWKTGEHAYQKFRKQLRNSDDPLKTWTEHFKLKVVSKPNRDDPEWTILEFNNPVLEKGTFQDICSSKLY